MEDAEKVSREAKITIQITSQGVTVIRKGRRFKKGPEAALDILRYTQLVMFG